MDFDPSWGGQNPGIFQKVGEYFFGYVFLLSSDASFRGYTKVVLATKRVVVMATTSNSRGCTP